MSVFLINEQRFYVLQALKPYWPHKSEVIFALPIPCATKNDSEPLPPIVRGVKLPKWAADISVNGELLVPVHFIVKNEEPIWKHTDWLGVIFWYLNGLAERTFEKLYGPIHSYSFRLKGWDARLWERAWVNRIALFLRRWTAKEKGMNEEKLLGPLPEPEIIITHDVDAVEKTISIRIKQTIFLLFNAFKSLLQKQLDTAIKKFKKAVLFFYTNDNYWHFEYITKLEELNNLRSYFYVYGTPQPQKFSLKRFLFDPSYNVSDKRLKFFLQKLHNKGWTIGLHQSFDAWKDSKKMYLQRKHLEKILGFPITTCRQHWLRFSWEYTWKAQQKAGLKLDTTLGFNDRPGFRNGAALEFRPWDFTTNAPIKLKVLPMILMDSQFYNYNDLDEKKRCAQIKYWLEEVYKTCGRATILWHSHVISNDFGWKDGFEQIIKIIASWRKSEN